MARQRVPVQVNQFIGGLNTEGNPLSFPSNASFDEANMEINSDGSRSRRGGFDVEADYVTVDTGIPRRVGLAGRTQFRWKNPGGDPSKQLLVVQIGNYLGVHDLDEFPLSDGLIYSTTFDIDTYNTNFDYAVVDGILVVANGLKEVTVLEYDSGTVTKSTKSLLIRDFFGVESEYDGDTLTEAQNLTIRPDSLSDEHTYNLRNQTFALPRVDGSDNDLILEDPLDIFYVRSGNTVYPSNSDSSVPHLVADSTKDSGRTLERFQASDLYNNPTGTGKAPQGYFIIDALERGESRLEQEQSLRDQYSDLTQTVSSLPEDITPGGATALAQYSGRVWFSGFSGEVTDGDGKSPRMSSYLLFSQVVTDPTQIGNCFQEADPTSHEDPDIVDTDGGFIKIDGAYGIKKLVPAGSSLFVFAENGVWRVLGSDGDSFRATGYSVFRLTDEGCVSSGSVVLSGSTMFYWGESDIFTVTKDQIGDWVVQNISEQTVDSLYSEISTSERSNVVGYHDMENSAVRWLYGNFLSENTSSKELILNTKFGAFTFNTIPHTDLAEGPFCVSGGQTFTGNVSEVVTVSGETVTVSGEDVTVPLTNQLRDASSTLYCVVLDYAPTITYTFGGYQEGQVLDWDLLGEGVDSPAYLVTGPLTGGDGRLRKDVPYLTTYFKQTEESDWSGDESSCFVRSQWDWTTDIDSGKWSNSRQAYRRPRAKPGQALIVTRNKIRGSGRSVSFRFESEEGKGMHLYGWDFNLESTRAE